MDNILNNPKTKRGEATMHKIIDAAKQTFYEKGYYHSTINDITNRANVGSGTFYIYFDSKLTLYRYLLIDYCERIRTNSSDAIRACKSRREAERVGIKSFFDFVLKEPEIFNIIWESLYIDKSLFDNFYTTFADSYSAKLRAAQLTGEVRDIDPEIVSYSLIGITNFLALNTLVIKDRKDVDYLVDEVMKMLDGGIFTNK